MNPKRTLASLIGTFAVTLGAARADEWRLVVDKPGVQVFQRPVAFSKVDEVRGVAILDMPADVLFRVLEDVQAYPGMIPPTVVARHLKDEAGNHYYYTEIDPPLIRRRYYCLRTRPERRPDGVMRVEWSLANELCPASQGGLVRINDNAGAWTLQPLDGGRTQVTYQAHTDPGGQVPAWIVNQATAKQIAELFKSLRKAAALPRYSQVQAGR